MRHIYELVNGRGHLSGICLLCLPEILMRRGRLILPLAIPSFVVVRAIPCILVLALIHNRVAGYNRHRSVDASSWDSAPCQWHPHAMIARFWHPVSRSTGLDLRVL